MRDVVVSVHPYLCMNLLLTLTGYCIYGLVSTQSLHFAHTVYLCASCNSQNKRQLDFALEKQLVSCEVVKDFLLGVL